MKTFIFMMLALVQNITQAWSDDAWTLRNQLLARAPYLSEEVIRKVGIENILPNAMLVEVLLANPDLLRNEGLIAFFATEIPSPLPQYYIDILKSSWAGNTPRSVLESAVAQQKSLASNHLNTLFRAWLQDSVKPSIDTLIAYTSLMPDVSSHYMLADLYYQKGENENALQMLQDIPTLFALNETEVNEHTYFSDLLNLKINLRNSNRTLFQLDATEKLLLQNISQASEAQTGIRASNILCFVYNECKEHAAILPTINNAPRKANIGLEFENMNIKAYPNPANEYISFDYDLAISNSSTYLSIKDITGKTVITFGLATNKGQQIWDTRNISSGTYLYELISDTKRIAIGKVVVQH